MNATGAMQSPDEQQASIATGRATDAIALRMYEVQLRSREFEERAFHLFNEGLVRGSIHLGIGQEAIAAGFAAAMRADDFTLCTYRGHNHLVARGVSMTAMFGELMGRAGGLMGGKGGSMHMTSVDHGMLGSYAIVGAHLPIAAGVAWSAQIRGSQQVTVCFFGDGATNIGAFHEALNLAAIWQLPIVFVCENNQYMEYTAIADVTAVEYPAADRASAYGLERIVIDGNDADVVFSMAGSLIERARSGRGPSLVEAMTYRHGGHSRIDPGDYRPTEEVNAWMERDPIPRLHSRLLSSGVTEARLAQIESAVKQEVADAVQEARDMPPAAEDSVAADVWSVGGSEWRV